MEVRVGGVELVKFVSNNELEVEEEEISQDFFSLICLMILFIRFFCCIRWALCILATGILAELAATWQRATWQEWTTVTTAIHHLERGTK